MSIRLRLLTYKELEQERETTSDRMELIEGEIVVTPAPSPFHQRVSGRLYSIFERLLPEQVFYAPVDVFLAEYSIVQPDPSSFYTSTWQSWPIPESKERPTS